MVSRMLAVWGVAAGLLLAGGVAQAADKKPETIDPAQVDADYALQGEYAGEGVGVQVIALGGGKFDAVVYAGGLPGAGWPKEAGKKEPAPMKGSGQKEGDAVKLSGDGWEAQIQGGQMMLKGKVSGSLKRVVRESPTLGAKPPAGAVVLFDGTEATAKKQFKNAKIVLGDLLLSEAETTEKFGSHRLHLEFRLSYMPEARGQGRSNSGVYIQNRYELQVLDSFGLEGRDNECGGIYSIAPPAFNMCLPPLQWQTYDIEFTAAKWEGDKKVKNAYAKIQHNGVTIHDRELTHGTPGKHKEVAGPDGFYLQGHGNKVVYRNIWLVPTGD